MESQVVGKKEFAEDGRDRTVAYLERGPWSG